MNTWRATIKWGTKSTSTKAFRTRDDARAAADHFVRIVTRRGFPVQEVRIEKGV